MKMDKIAILITGAMGGLGQALVRMSNQLTDIEYVIATDIRSEIENFFNENKKIVGLQMDVGSERSIRKVYNDLQEKGITVKYLINNAGVSFFHPVSESTEELLDKTLRVNTYGPILTVSVFLDDLIKNKGRVIQISSVSVKLPTLFQPYPNSKIALEAFSTSMRQELELHGVKLILIRPGAIKTNLTEEMNSIENPVQNSQFQKHFNRFAKIAQSSIGKMVEPEKVADLIRKVIITKKPNRIYSINSNAKITLFTLVPKKWRDDLILGALKKEHKKG